ncbi:MAG TPA: 16S rRNA (guanine(527)-N(7))-methyltransferase RsmG [Spirochaetota bacterium]|nr:16S rRNA (guanine(527)-N(7))-methyltransferase RsmG [Spirochaetota bacterium]
MMDRRPEDSVGHARGAGQADEKDGMFHVEREAVREWAERNGIVLPEGAAGLLARYAGMVIEANGRHNLTGCSTTMGALEALVLGSLEPLCRLDVPRGTRFADIGSGAGVPGIPLALALSGITGVLMEAQAKRAEFLEYARKELPVPGLSVVCGRTEELARVPEWRGAFDAVFSRAFGPVYAVIEMALPLLKTGGYLYIYSKLLGADLGRVIADHAMALGGRIDTDPMGGPGIMVRKVGETPDAYPRRYPAIKRAAERIGGDAGHET